MKGEHIGELEELVLLTVGSLYQDAYAVNIMDQIHIHTSRKIDVTAIHSVLRRLDKKGLVESEMGGSTTERGGRMELRSTLYNKLPKLTFSKL